MKFEIKSDISLKTAGITIFVFIALAAFCQLVNFSLVIPLLLLLTGLHIFFNKQANYKLLINLSFLVTLIIFAAHGFKEYLSISYLFIPVASVAMLTMLLYNDLQLAYLMALISSIFVCLVIGADLNLLLVFFVGSLTAAYTVREARTRSHLINAGFFVGVMQVVCTMLLNPESDVILSKAFWIIEIRPLFINGFIAAIIVMTTSKIFESMFGVLTNFSLLELSDFNHPLLKRMVLEAPGTYHHSLIVSNLSEAAADSIGANALLTRVGAYYHDIGKMVKPEYFTENQLVDGNKHDNIEPSMSRLVILNHVKEGIELAKKNKLNPLIIDFIPQHHGTGLIYYFYQKALEGAEDHEDVQEENFRYPGPKPQTRETAIVMLADSVEGATRALDEPTPKKIEEVVRKIINNRFIDGQLDECNLTLKEIDRISHVFTRVLSAMYHGRVKYPEKKNGNGNNIKKSAEKNKDNTFTTNQDRPEDSSS